MQAAKSQETKRGGFSKTPCTINSSCRHGQRTSRVVHYRYCSSKRLISFLCHARPCSDGATQWKYVTVYHRQNPQRKELRGGDLLLQLKSRALSALQAYRYAFFAENEACSCTLLLLGMVLQAPLSVYRVPDERLVSPKDASHDRGSLITSRSTVSR